MDRARARLQRLERPVPAVGRVGEQRGAVRARERHDHLMYRSRGYTARAGEKFGEFLGLARAPAWDGPFEKVQADPIVKESNEDPFMWRDAATGHFHAITRARGEGGGGERRLGRPAPRSARVAGLWYERPTARMDSRAVSPQAREPRPHVPRARTATRPSARQRNDVDAPRRERAARALRPRTAARPPSSSRACSSPSRRARVRARAARARGGAVAVAVAVRRALRRLRRARRRVLDLRRRDARRGRERRGGVLPAQPQVVGAPLSLGESAAGAWIDMDDEPCAARPALCARARGWRARTRPGPTCLYGSRERALGGRRTTRAARPAACRRRVGGFTARSTRATGTR